MASGALNPSVPDLLWGCPVVQSNSSPCRECPFKRYPKHEQGNRAKFGAYWSHLSFLWCVWTLTVLFWSFISIATMLMVFLCLIYTWDFPSGKTEICLLWILLCADTSPSCAIQCRTGGNGGGICQSAKVRNKIASQEPLLHRTSALIRCNRRNLASGRGWYFASYLISVWVITDGRGS